MSEFAQPRRAAASRMPILAVVGRPNAGKSTLFNRLARERKAIVHDLPGVTRDRNYAAAEWAGKKFTLVDTGGLEGDAKEGLEERVQEQSRTAIQEADVILFLLDGKEGLNPIDRGAVDRLRKSGKPVFFAVNKLDTPRRQENLYEFYALGLSRLFPISAEHGLGVSELMDEVIALLPAESATEPAENAAPPLTIAIVGRPNVGKSTLTNRLLGFERSVVDSRPGTTRDALETPFTIRDQECVLIDTAGVRRKARIDDRVEEFSVQRALRSVDRGDLVIHLIDGIEGVTDQDAQILSYASQRGKALVLAVNKWDVLMKGGVDADAYREEVRRKLAFLEHVPILLISAATGHGIRKMLDTSARVLKNYAAKSRTSAINEALQQIVRAHPAPQFQGRPVKFYYATQTGVRPPAFTIFVNFPMAVADSYRRYLAHELRTSLGLEYAPVKVILRPRRDDPAPQRARRSR